ncbi:hypothetical protein AVEN_273507-1 [Araneus ventricosus]|uniref:Uncharacterized protein n=1 Tax=Araneus ventricosus TaxID=182803 RepID=A0A4Y2H5I5_ARAVE|nr:hypothetical protein AVEN_273507-1 [Araneus ventricosus]
MEALSVVLQVKRGRNDIMMMKLKNFHDFIHGSYSPVNERKHLLGLNDIIKFPTVAGKGNKNKRGEDGDEKANKSESNEKAATSAGEFVKSPKRTTRTAGDPIPNGVVEIISKIDRNEFVDGVDNMMIKNLETFGKYSNGLTKDKKQFGQLLRNKII